MRINNRLIERVVRESLNKLIKESESNKKYELVEDDTKQRYGTTLYRIRALRDFGDVKAGDLGGYIEHEDNLSHEGDCWVYDKAEVCGNAGIYNWAKVYDYAEVLGYAAVGGSAEVYGNAKVSQSAVVSGNAKVYGDAVVRGSCLVYNKAQVYGESEIYGDARVGGFYKAKDEEIARGIHE